MSKVLVGATGMVGADFESLDLIRPKRSELDILDKDSLVKYFENTRPSVVINCVGVCGGECEASPIKTHELNVNASLNLAIASNLFRFKLIHITSSLAGYGNLYTISKYYAEELLRRVCHNLCIVETTWLFAKNNDKGFLSTVIDCLNRNIPIPVYDGEVGTPTYAKDLADYITENAEFLFDRVVVANEGCATRREWAKEIAELKGFSEFSFTPIERPIPINPNTHVIGNMRDWRESLRACLCDKGFSHHS